jgi:hypothetical protein
MTCLGGRHPVRIIWMQLSHPRDDTMGLPLTDPHGQGTLPSAISSSLRFFYFLTPTTLAYNPRILFSHSPRFSALHTLNFSSIYFHTYTSGTFRCLLSHVGLLQLKEPMGTDGLARTFPHSQYIPVFPHAAYSVCCLRATLFPPKSQNVKFLRMFKWNYCLTREARRIIVCETHRKNVYAVLQIPRKGTLPLRNV